MAIAIVYVDVAFGASKACKSVMGKFSCRQLELKKSIVAWQASKLSSWIDGVGVKLSVLQVALKIDFYLPPFHELVCFSSCVHSENKYHF